MNSLESEIRPSPSSSTRMLRAIITRGSFLEKLPRVIIAWSMRVLEEGEGLVTRLESQPVLSVRAHAQAERRRRKRRSGRVLGHEHKSTRVNQIAGFHY